MRKFFLAGAALGLFALGVPAPASAMPVGKIAANIASGESGVTEVRYRRYSRGYYRPRIIRRYGYYGGGPSYYGPGSGTGYGRSYGGPYYGPGSGTGFGGGYGRSPSIGFSFGGGRW